MGRTKRVKVSITKRVVDSAVAHGKRDAFVWDDEVRGFALRVRAGSGKKIYVLRYGAGKAGRSRWVTIGHHGSPWTPETARIEARRVLGLVAGGTDPAKLRDFGRTIPTLAEYAAVYIRDYASAHKAARSVAEDERNLKLHIIPALGELRVNELTHADVARWHAGRRDHPVNSNRCLALVSHMMTTAERWGLRTGPNPCRHVERYGEKSRKRFLSTEELMRLGAALAETEKGGRVSPFPIACIRLLLLTGARKSELATLKWTMVDLERGLLMLPESKTGERAILLNAPAKKILSDLPRVEDSPWVFPSSDPKKHLGGLDDAWQRIRAAAKLEDIHLHDLRHSAASFAIAAGGTLPLIGGLLGHVTASTTQRYAHLSANPMRDLSEAIGRTVSAAFEGRKPTKVQQMRRRVAR